MNTTTTNTKFFEAVDIVCMDCHFLSEETCKVCPVRKTCDAMSEKKDTTEYKTIYELTNDQLDELRDNLYWQRDDDSPWESPADITDSILFKHYGHISFTDDDFFCTAGKEVN